MPPSSGSPDPQKHLRLDARGRWPKTQKRRNEAVTWFNYTPLTPLIEKYSDDGSRDLLRVECDLGENGLYRVAAVGEQNHVELIRVQSVHSDGNLSPEQARLVSQLVDHMITVLRLTTDQHVEKLWFGQDTISIGSHGDENGKPNLGIRISLHSPADFKVDYANVAAVYSQTIAERSLLKLLGDSQYPTLPLQYKYLSLYKILEHEFRVDKKWPGLQDLLAPCEAHFKALGASAKSLDNFLHDLRDKCAHIRIGKKSELGITGLNSHDTALVEKVMPLLRQAVFLHLSKKYPNLRFSPPAPPSDINLGKVATSI
jgi:hypothetical protein